MAIGDKPTIVKGRLTIPDRAITKEFMWNPNEITDEKGSRYGILDIPGISHPVYQFGSGSDRTFTFDLFLDGDRGKLDQRAGGNSVSLSVKDDINFYRSLIYPAPTNDFLPFTGLNQMSPYILLFSFGELYQQVPVIIKDRISIRYTQFTPKLEPVKATLSLVLTEVIDFTQNFEDVMPSNFLR